MSMKHGLLAHTVPQQKVIIENSCYDAPAKQISGGLKTRHSRNGKFRI